MKYKANLFNLTLTGTLTGLAVLFGAFIHFPLFGSDVFLIGIVVYLMPVLLPFIYAWLGSVIAVLISDILSGWIGFAWISVIAYSVAVLVIFVFAEKIKIIWKKSSINVEVTDRNNIYFYISGLILASLLAIFIYSILFLMVFGSAIAYGEFLTDLIQFFLVTFVASFLYVPLIKIKNHFAF